LLFPNIAIRRGLLVRIENAACKLQRCPALMAGDEAHGIAGIGPDSSASRADGKQESLPVFDSLPLVMLVLEPISSFAQSAPDSEPSLVAAPKVEHHLLA
jgi:hypothetical protein